jgi:competence protein ComEA
MSNSYLKNRKNIKVMAIAAVAVALIIFAVFSYQGKGDSGAGAVDVLSGGGSAGSDGSAEAGTVITAGAAAPASGAGEAVAATAAGAVSGSDTLAMSADIYVDVGGAVKKALVAALPSGSRVSDAIEAAGGLTKEADITYINRAALLNDGDRVYIPSRDEVKSGAPIPASTGIIGGQGAAAGAAGGDDSGAGAGQGGASGAGEKINNNAADSAALQELNGVGPATAQKIIDYREQNGPFAKIEDIKNVSGIGEKTFEKLKDYIAV